MGRSNLSVAGLGLYEASQGISEEEGMSTFPENMIRTKYLENLLKDSPLSWYSIAKVFAVYIILISLPNTFLIAPYHCFKVLPQISVQGSARLPDHMSRDPSLQPSEILNHLRWKGITQGTFSHAHTHARAHTH